AGIYSEHPVASLTNTAKKLMSRFRGSLSPGEGRRWGARGMRESPIHEDYEELREFLTASPELPVQYGHPLSRHFFTTRSDVPALIVKARILFMLLSERVDRIESHLAGGTFGDLKQASQLLSEPLKHDSNQKAVHTLVFAEHHTGAATQLRP